jgi:hypothetical protein
VLAALAALAVGVVSGTAGALLHQAWWGLAIALGTALVVLAWLPPGALRVAFAAGWCVAAIRGAVTRSGGGFLVGSDAAGLSFLAGSAVLLVAAVVSAAAAGRVRPRHADDQGDRGPAT